MRAGRGSTKRKTPAGQETLARGRIVERADGFYWRAPGGGAERGPFPTLAEAEADMLAGGAGEFEPAESLQEAESQVGIADWIDPETGSPAEDWMHRLEDH